MAEETRVYKITDPETGQTRRVRGPVDATPEELQNFATETFRNPAPSKEPATPGPVDPTDTSAVPGRAGPERKRTDLQPRGFNEWLSDTGVGAMRSGVNALTRSIDVLSKVPEVWAKGAKLVAPGVGQYVEDKVKAVQEDTQRGRDYWQQRYEQAGPAAFTGGMAADTAIGSPLVKPAMTAATAIIPRLAGESGRRAITRLSAASAGAGGATGALTAEDASEGALFGTLSGAAVPPLLRKSILGINKSPAGASLLNQGVPLTTGLAAPNSGMGSVITGGETMGRWLPFAGHVIENSQQKAVRGWRDLAISKTNVPETPAGPAVPAGTTIKSGRTVDDVIQEQNRVITDRRTSAMSGAKFDPDRELEEALLRITTDPNRPLDKKGVQLLNDLYQRAMVHRIRGDTPTPGNQIIIPGRRGLPTQPQPAHWTGEDVLKGQEIFEKWGNRFARNSNDPFKEAAGRGMQDFSEEILQMIERQNPMAGQTVRALEGPRKAAQVLRRTAGKSSGQGTFTPTQLVRESQKLEHGDLETVGREGAEVFGNLNTGVRTKGTDLRSLMQWLGVAGHLVSPEVALATGTGMAGYIPAVQRTALGQTKAQKALVELLRRKGLGDLVKE